MLLDSVDGSGWTELSKGESGAVYEVGELGFRDRRQSARNTKRRIQQSATSPIGGARNDVLDVVSLGELRPPGRGLRSETCLGGHDGRR